MGEINYDNMKKKDIFITNLTIFKVRHLKDIEIPLSNTERKHLILTGKNGSGKTSVLENLKQIFDIIYTMGEVNAVERGIKLDFNTPLGRYNLEENLILAIYKAERLAKMNIPKGPQKLLLKKNYGVAGQPGKDFIQYIVNMKVEKSFARDEKDNETVEKIENWFEVFEKSLKEIFNEPDLKLEFDRKNYNYNIIQEGKEPFDFNTLADGYSALINIVTDLILRMEKYKGKSYDMQGIVLIDELEAHLHIDLQKKVLPFLTGFFPRIQFVVSTHSPFVLNSIKNAVIYDLEKQLLVEDLSAYSCEGIVESYFDNDGYSRAIKDKIETYERLTKKKKPTEDEEEQMIELRNYLKKIPGSLSPGLKAKFQQIELERKNT